MKFIFKTFFTAVAAFLLTGHPAAGSEASLDQLEIRGKIQLWKRHCSSTGSCSLPRPIGPATELTGMIAAPEPGQGSTVSLKSTMRSAQTDQQTTATAWEVEVQIFRKTKSNPSDTSYTASQVTIRESESGKIHVLCSSYEPEQLNGLFFPVGACGAMLSAAEGISTPIDQTMWGVSFFR